MVKLYSKKLTSLDELRREKALRKKEAAEVFDNVFKPDPASDGIIPALIDIATSKGIANKLLALAIPVAQMVGNKVEKNMLKRLAIEVLGGYAKWKGTEVGLKALFRYMKRRYERHEGRDEKQPD